MDTANKLTLQYPMTMAAANPTTEIHVRSVTSKMAGNVITDSVTYGT